MSFRTSKQTPLPAVLRSFRYAVQFSRNISLDVVLLLSQDSEQPIPSGFIIVYRCFKVGYFVDHTTTVYDHNTQVFCGRSNTDDLVLELVDLASLEERDELLIF